MPSSLSLSLSVRYIRFNYIRKYRALPLTARINFCFWLEPKCTHNAHIQRHKEVHTKWKHTNHLRRSSRHRKKSYLQNSAWSQIKHSHTSTRKKIFANSQQKKNAEIQFWIFSNRTLFSSFSRLNVKSQEIKRKEYYFLDFFCLTPRTNGIKLNFWKFSKKRNKINQRTRETLMP